jgi:outer membrane protein
LQRKYEKGAADILEILQTQAALTDAQKERISSLSDWHSARLRLLASVGFMGREAVTP